MKKRIVQSVLLLAVVGAVAGSDSVTAFASAGPLEQDEQSQTGIPQNAAYVMRTVDASPPFDTTLGAPTSVGLVSFTATRVKNKPKQITVKWKTAAEPNALGFRLYRQVGTKKTRIGGLVPSKGAFGGAYSRTDTLPKTVAKACYRLDVVSTQGAAAPVKTICMKK